MRMPIMGPGGEPFNGHDGDFFPMQGGLKKQVKKFSNVSNVQAPLEWVQE